MKRFLLLLLLSVPVFLLAQSAMSLDDCIRLAYKQNPAVRNGVIGIKEAKADYIASVGAFLPQIVVNAETGRRFGRSLDPDTNGYTSESFEEGTVGLDMTLSLFEGFSRINQVRFRKMNKERSEWELKEKQNELAYQVTGDGCLLHTDSGEKIARSCFGTKPVERKVFETDRGLRGTGIEISLRFTGGESAPGGRYLSLSVARK